MEHDFSPRCSIILGVEKCINCGSNNIQSCFGDVYGSKHTQCDDCKTSFGHCSFCKKDVIIEEFVELFGLKKSIDISSLLNEHTSCKFDKISAHLKVPDEIWNDLNLNPTDAKAGSWNSYCCECNKLLLISLWFYG